MSAHRSSSASPDQQGSTTNNSGGARFSVERDQHGTDDEPSATAAAVVVPRNVVSAKRREPRTEMNTSDKILPAHMEAIVNHVNNSLQSVQKLTSNLVVMSSSELHAAQRSLKTILASQKASVDDLVFCATQEMKHAMERMHDLRVELASSGSQKIHTETQTLNFVYSVLQSTVGMANATQGAVLVFPSESQHGQVTAEQVLRIICHVSEKTFSPLTDGSIHTDIYDVCSAVARARCAANITALSTGAPRSFKTLLACPILLPHNDAAAVLGVVLLLDKVSQYEEGTRDFTRDDEARLQFCAEHVGELLSQLPRNFSSKRLVPLSPAMWQEQWARWTGHSNSSNRNVDSSNAQPTTPANSGVSSQLRLPLPKSFVFRFHHEGRSLSALEFKSRTAIDVGEVMIDVLDRYHTLETNLELANARVASMAAARSEMQLQLDQSREAARRAQYDVNSMRVANERLLRLKFLDARRSEENLAAAAVGKHNVELANNEGGTEIVSSSSHPPLQSRAPPPPPQAAASVSYPPLPPPAVASSTIEATTRSSATSSGGGVQITRRVAATSSSGSPRAVSSSFSKENNRAWRPKSAAVAAPPPPLLQSHVHGRSWGASDVPPPTRWNRLATSHKFSPSRRK